MTKQFPVLTSGYTLYGKPLKAKSIPWEIVEPHREQAMKNHGQTLERLAERGGLSASELVAILCDRSYYDVWGWE